MPELAFLPNWPPLANNMFWIGALLAVGVACGEAVRRFLRLPRITGYAAAGLALGPGGLGLIDNPVLEDLGVFADVAIGLVLFELGQRLDLAWLRRTPALALMGVAESLGAAALVFFTLHYYFDLVPLAAGIAAAIAVSTSPAALMRVAADLRAEGQVTERALIVTAINGVLAFLALTVLIPWLHFEYRGGWLTMVTHPLYLLGGSAALALVAGWFTLRLAGLIGKSPERQFIAVIAMVVMTVGIAIALKVSVLLALLGMGALVRNADREHHLVVVDSGNAGQLFYVCLFVITGASLDLALLATALAPMSGLAVVLVHQTAALYPEIRESVAPVVLAAVVMLELAGPIATQFALRRAGEAEEGA